MCNKCKQAATEKNGIELESAVKRLSLKNQELSEFLLKFTKELKPAQRSETYSSLMQELSRIVGGVRTSEHPECCLVGSRNPNGTYSWFCTGALVTPKLVLTAAHCIKPGRSYVVALNTEEQNAMANAEIIGVRKAIVNPQYFNTNTNNDIAALVLQNNATTPPVEIASPKEITNSQKVTLVGFGNDDLASTKGFGTKRTVDVDIISLRKSKTEDFNKEESKYGFESDLEFVAGGKGFDTCNGDSGGPVYITSGTQTKLAGLTSRATVNSVNPCGDGGIYTRLDTQREFINSILSTI